MCWSRRTTKKKKKLSSGGSGDDSLNSFLTRDRIAHRAAARRERMIAQDVMTINEADPLSLSQFASDMFLAAGDPATPSAGGAVATTSIKIKDSRPLLHRGVTERKFDAAKKLTKFKYTKESVKNLRKVEAALDDPVGLEINDMDLTGSTIADSLTQEESDAGMMSVSSSSSSTSTTSTVAGPMFCQPKYDIKGASMPRCFPTADANVTTELNLFDGGASPQTCATDCAADQFPRLGESVTSLTPLVLYAESDGMCQSCSTVLGAVPLSGKCWMGANGSTPVSNCVQSVPLVLRMAHKGTSATGVQDAAIKVGDVVDLLTLRQGVLVNNAGKAQLVSNTSDPLYGASHWKVHCSSKSDGSEVLVDDVILLESVDQNNNQTSTFLSSVGVKGGGPLQINTKTNESSWHLTSHHIYMDTVKTMGLVAQDPTLETTVPTTKHLSTGTILFILAAVVLGALIIGALFAKWTHHRATKKAVKASAGAASPTPIAPPTTPTTASTTHAPHPPTSSNGQSQLQSPATVF